MEKRRLNLGCGDVFSTDWVNIDVLGDPAGHILKYNLNLGIPFGDDTFDFVYHSHIIEHFTHKRGRFFLEECFRVLKEGGVLRVAFPDLEAIARNYVQALDDIKAGKPGAQDRRRWMTIELYDQVVREKSGGEMLEYTHRQFVPEADFVISRMGKGTAQAIEYNKTHPQPIQKEPLKATTVYNSDFKNCGELHQWMYDFYALEETLREIGFGDIKRVEYNTSCSEDYLKYNFDRDDEGHIRKPDSAFIEAVKPFRVNDEKKIKVAIFSALDHGDAGAAAVRQHKGLRKIGVKSELYTGYQKTADNAIQIVPLKSNSFVNGENGEVFLSSFLQKWQSWSSAAEKYPQVMGEYCFVHSDSFNPNEIMFIKDFDLINLESVNGFADPTVHPEYYQNKPIVWTLHDMNALTGGCFNSFDCRNFEKECGACPLLGSCNKNDVSNEIFAKRLAAYQKLDLNIVTPSNWLAGEVKKSALLGRFPVTVIPDSCPLDVFVPLDRMTLRAMSGITPNDIVLLFKTEDLSSPKAGSHFVIESLRKMAGTELASRLILLVMGQNPVREFLETGIRTQILNYIDNEETARILYNIADALLFTSVNASQAIAESLSCGTPVIAFSCGGIPEMINHSMTGWLAAKNNTDDLCSGIKWLSMVSPEVHTLCRNFAMEHFDETKQAERYYELYQQLLKK